MKRGTKLLVLTGALVVVVAGCFIAAKIADRQTEDTTDTSVAVTGGDDGDLTAMSWTYGGETLELSKDGDDWQVSDQADFPLDPQYSSAMAAALTDVTATRQLAVPDDLSDYGLDAPTLTVTGTYAQTGERTFLIGAQNAVSEDYYMMLEGGDAVYMVDSAILTAFSKSLNDLVQFEDIPAMNTPTAYLLAAPDGTTTQMTQVSDDLKSDILGLTWQKCADYSATEDELAQYGLAPGTSVTVTYEVTDSGDTADDDSAAAETDTFTVLIGADADDTYTYAKLPDSSIVYLIYKTEADALLQPQS